MLRRLLVKLNGELVIYFLLDYVFIYFVFVVVLWR